VVERGGGASGATAGCHRVVGRQWRVVVAPIVDYRKEVRGADRRREVVRWCGEIAVAPPRLWVADGRWQVSQGRSTACGRGCPIPIPRQRTASHEERERVM
jgi:hypothetical protein